MIALVPDHMLQEEYRVIIVLFHLLSCLNLALHSLTHCLRALIQHFRHAIGISLGDPLALMLNRRSGKLRRIFLNEHQTYVMDMGQHLADGQTSLYRAGIQTALRNDANEVGEDDVVAVPGIEQSLKKT